MNEENQSNMNFSSFNRRKKKEPRVETQKVPLLTPEVVENPLMHDQHQMNPAYKAPQVTQTSEMEEDEHDIDLRDYVGVILHRRYWLIATIIISIVVGFVTKLNFNPQYSAQSRLRIVSMSGVNDHDP